MADFEDDTQSRSEDEEEAMTSAEALQKLEEAWLNEKFAPELLEAKTELVECMMDLIQEMEENIKRAKKGDFKVSVCKMEIDRIRFVLSSYLRIRLEKVEKYAAHILETDKNLAGDNPRLSPEEQAYAKEFQENMESHFKLLALRHMPPNLQSMDTKQTMVQPNLDSFVFLKVNTDVQGVQVEEETAESREEIIDLEKGDQHIMRYRPVAPHVTSGDVSLI